MAASAIAGGVWSALAPRHGAYPWPLSLFQHDTRNALANRVRERFSNSSSWRSACASAVTVLMVPPGAAPPCPAFSASASSGGSPNRCPAAPPSRHRRAEVLDFEKPRIGLASPIHAEHAARRVGRGAHQGIDPARIAVIERRLRHPVPKLRFRQEIAAAMRIVRQVERLSRPCQRAVSAAGKPAPRSAFTVSPESRGSIVILASVPVCEIS